MTRPEDAAGALEEELLSAVQEPEEVKMDVDVDEDVDKAVAELVEETLDGPPASSLSTHHAQAKHEEQEPAMMMELDSVDVEDELLSLVDDRASQHHTHSHAHSHSHHATLATKPPPLKLDEASLASGSRQTSPLASASISAVEQRGSMPPPKGKKERAGSIAANGGATKKKVSSMCFSSQ